MALDANTLLLLHGNGSDNGTTITDEMGRTITRYGNICTKTGTKKFGTASMYFDGSGDYLRAANSADFCFGTGNFTIDFWMNFSSTSGTYYLYDNIPAYQDADYRLCAYISNGKLGFRINGANSEYSTTLTAGQWYHIAIVGEGSKVTIFLDGVAVITRTTNYNISDSKYQNCIIGNNNDCNSCFKGYMDEIRISNVARWTGNFTPPIAEYGGGEPVTSAGIFFAAFM